MNKKGFTLVELMVVIVIIGVLAAVAIPKMMAATNKAKAGEGPQILRAIASMEAAYKAETDTFLVSTPTAKTTPATTADESWKKLGFDPEPFSKYFAFKVDVPDANSTFTANATLYVSLGDAKTNEVIAINEKDIRLVNGATNTGADALSKLLPNWK